MTQPASALERLLQDLLTHSQALEDLLRAEQRAVAEQNLAEVTRAAEAKLERLNALERLDQECRRTLRAVHLPENAEGMDTLLAAPAYAGLRETWQTVKESLRRGQAMNEASGSIIRRSLDDNRRLLDILHGGHEAPSPVYGPEGTTSQSGGRDLGSA